MTRIQAQTQKEARLLALRARVSALKKIMEQQISLAPYLDTTFRIALPPTLQSFSLADNSSVRISLSTNTVDEALSIVQTIITLTNERKIRNPLFTSLSMTPNGAMTFSVTYGVNL